MLYTLFALVLGGSTLLFSQSDQEGDRADQDRSRSYQKRRSYTKKIDMAGAESKQELKLPGKQTSKFDTGLDFPNEDLSENDFAIDPGSGSRPSPPRPRIDQSDSDNNWLVNALLKTDEDKEEDGGIGAAFGVDSSQNWGWLAKGADEDGEQREAEENVYGAEDFEEESDEEEELRARSDRFSDFGEEAERGMIRDHDEEARQRYEIFNVMAEEGGSSYTDEQREATSNYTASSEAEYNTSSDEYEESRPAWLQSFTDQDSSARDSYARDSHSRRNADSNRVAPSRFNSQQSPSRERNSNRSRNNDYNTGSDNRFRSAFERGNRNKFRSSFQTRSDSSFGNDDVSRRGGNNNNAYNPAGSYQSRRRNTGGAGYSSPARETSSNSSGKLNKFNATKKRTSQSLNQWD